MQSGGALAPSAVTGDPPENLAWMWIPDGSFERQDASALSTLSPAFAAGRREQHSGRVLHPASGSDHALPQCRSSVSAITDGVSAMAMPAAWSASILPAAVPLPPETMAPA